MSGGQCKLSKGSFSLNLCPCFLFFFSIIPIYAAARLPRSQRVGEASIPSRAPKWKHQKLVDGSDLEKRLLGQNKQTARLLLTMTSSVCAGTCVCVCEPLLTSPCQPVIPGPRGKPLLGCTCSSSKRCEKLLPLCSGLSHCYNGNGITRRKSQAKSKYNLQSYLLELMLCRMLYAQCSCAGEPSNLHILALGVSY